MSDIGLGVCSTSSLKNTISKSLVDVGAWRGIVMERSDIGRRGLRRWIGDGPSDSVEDVEIVDKPRSDRFVTEKIAVSGRC